MKMKNPNDYGCIRIMSGNRRRPYAFIATVDGRQKYIAAFETIYDAKVFQAQYYEEHHRDFPPSYHKKITFSELYFRWLSFHKDEDRMLSKSTLTGYEYAYSHCVALYDKYFPDLQYLELQAIINHMRFKENLSYSSCKKVKNLLSLMYKYAIKANICRTNYALLLSIGRNHPVYPHHVISRQKINRLWNAFDYAGTDTVLILLYTGMRVSEMLNILKSEVNLRQRYLRITHSKTASGIRIIPIHSRILPLISERMAMPGPNLINDQSGCPYGYSRYRSGVWHKVMKHIRGEKHTPHDTRHTFTTLLDNAGANENAKRQILGHATGDVTNRVYTHKSLRQLRKCIELLK